MELEKTKQVAQTCVYKICVPSKNCMHFFFEENGRSSAIQLRRERVQVALGKGVKARKKPPHYNGLHAQIRRAYN